MTNFFGHLTADRISEFKTADGMPFLTTWENKHLQECADCMNVVRQAQQGAIQENEARKAAQYHNERLT